MKLLNLEICNKGTERRKTKRRHRVDIFNMLKIDDSMNEARAN